MANEKRLYQSIVAKMQEMIRSGVYPPGGRLPPERELAERFSVSRPTIREAIIALETLGQVQVKTGSGVYVLEPKAGHNDFYTTVSPFELTEARALIEGEAAAQAALMITDAQLNTLEQTLDEMSARSSGDELAGEQADKKFHHTIAVATQNTMLTAVIDHLWHVRESTPTISNAYRSVYTDEREREQEHREIYAALKRRDPNAAKSAMHAHFSRLLKKLIEANETEQIEAARRRAVESRERFSLDRLS